jgi:hypothetical protein
MSVSSYSHSGAIFAFELVVDPIVLFLVDRSFSGPSWLVCQFCDVGCEVTNARSNSRIMYL